MAHSLIEKLKEIKSKQGAGSVHIEIKSLEQEQRRMWGWASIIEKNGKVYVDSHGDAIDQKALLDAAEDFMKRRVLLSEHTGEKRGEVVQSMVMTKELQDALGIDLGIIGWLVCVKVESDEMWQQAKDGKFTGFSIGYTAERKPLNA